MNEVILKADRRGRLRYTAEQKQALIEAYQSAHMLPVVTAHGFASPSGVIGGLAVRHTFGALP